jgi:hypothetical protein
MMRRLSSIELIGVDILQNSTRDNGTVSTPLLKSFRFVVLSVRLTILGQVGRHNSDDTSGTGMGR